MDWLTPLIGLAGVTLGAATSYASTHQAQKQQISEARQARDEAECAAVVAANAKALIAILGHVRKIPADFSPSSTPETEWENFSEREAEWQKDLLDLIEPARVAALEVRDEKVRTLIIDGLTRIHDCQSIDLGPYRRSREWLLRGTVHYLIDCLFTWRRGDTQLPKPTSRYERLQEIWEYDEEVRRIEAEEIKRSRNR